MINLWLNNTWEINPDSRVNGLNSNQFLIHVEVRERCRVLQTVLFHVGFTVKLYLALDRYCSLFSGDHEFAESIVAVTHGVTKRGHVNKASRCCRRCVKFDRFLAVIFEATAAPFCLPLRSPPHRLELEARERLHAQHLCSDVIARLACRFNGQRQIRRERFCFHYHRHQWPP